MANAVDIVKQLNDACMAKDFDKVSSLIDPNYTLRDPKMSFNSADEFIEFMKNCPFDGRFENHVIAVDANNPNKVIQIMDCVMTSPVAYTFRMCDILNIKNGKVVSEEMIYDTAQIPEEANKITEDMMNKAKAA